MSTERVVLSIVCFLAACGGGGGDDTNSDAHGVDPVCNNHDFSSAACWTSFDTKTVDAGVGELFGGTFDGRYIYFSPHENASIKYGKVVRYDTQGAFTAPASWSTFDVKTVNPNAAGFAGAVYDGHYVYFTASEQDVSSGGIVARYDTSMPFTTAAAWTVFDARAQLAQSLVYPQGYAGSVFDGRYLYLVPYTNLGGRNDVALRYDTTMSFTTTSSWELFRMSTFDTACYGFYGGVYDGRYVYYVPYDNGAQNDAVCRYDTQGAFTAIGSWSKVGLTSLNADANTFEGAVFDGKHITFAPARTEAAAYDTTAAFATAGLSSFYLTPLGANAKGYFGGTFDGRYVYLAPNVNTAGQVTTIALRWDSTAGFGDASAWSAFDIAPLPGGFGGAIFDGHYVYYPNFEGNVVRFDAKDPGALPTLPAFHGSFF